MSILIEDFTNVGFLALYSRKSMQRYVPQYVNTPYFEVNKVRIYSRVLKETALLNSAAKVNDC